MITAWKSGWLFPDKMEIRALDWTPGPSIERRTTMGEYIGLDVSLKDTAISVRRDGKRIWRGKCPSDPNLIAEVVRQRAPACACGPAGGVRDRSFVGVVLSCAER